MILTAVTLCAIVTYREARSTSFSEQLDIASVIYNRAKGIDYTDIAKVVYAKNQFSSMTNTKPKQKFNNYNAMFDYYNIKESQAYATAISACNLARDYRADYTHFTNKNLKVSWHKGMKRTNTESFSFYKEGKI